METRQKSSRGREVEERERLSRGASRERRDRFESKEKRDSRRAEVRDVIGERESAIESNSKKTSSR